MPLQHALLSLAPSRLGKRPVTVLSSNSPLVLHVTLANAEVCCTSGPQVAGLAAAKER